MVSFNLTCTTGLGAVTTPSALQRAYLLPAFAFLKDITFYKSNIETLRLYVNHFKLIITKLKYRA